MQCTGFYNCEVYQTWRKNIPELYDVLITDGLASPSLTIQWLPDEGKYEDEIKGKFKQRVMLGTNRYADENHLIIAKITFSEEKLKNKIDQEAFTVCGSTTSGVHRMIEIEKEIKHEGGVNRARYMPQIPAIIATKPTNGNILIFDLRKHASNYAPRTACNPDLRLIGLSNEGCSVTWNPSRKGYILSCSNERDISVWDVCAKTTENRSIKVLLNYRNRYSCGVRECAWHGFNGFLFGSVGKTKKLHIWDIRDFSMMPALTGIGHKGSINCLSFNNISENILATGSCDKTIAIWDMRKLKSPTYHIKWQTYESCQLQWCPNKKDILASSGVHYPLTIWDISKCERKTSRDKITKAPELLFIHGGHTAKVSDYSWNTNVPWLITSISLDKMIHVWKIKDNFFNKPLLSKSPQLP